MAQELRVTGGTSYGRPADRHPLRCDRGDRTGRPQVRAAVGSDARRQLGTAAYGGVCAKVYSCPSPLMTSCSSATRQGRGHDGGSTRRRLEPGMPPGLRCRWWGSHTEGASELLIIQLLANLTAWVKRATTHTNSTRLAYVSSRAPGAGLPWPGAGDMRLSWSPMPM